MTNGDKCSFCGTKYQLFLRDIFDSRFGISSTFKLVNCSSCNTAQTLPVLHEDRLKAFYKKYYNYERITSESYSKIRSAFFSTSLYQIWILIDGNISFYSKQGKGLLLDLGCNEGRGLRIYKKNGFHVQGLELNERAATFARNCGFNVITIPIEDYRPENLYDVVVLSNVLEHSLNPKKMLANVLRLLKKGGQVWISCPNVNSWQRKIFNKYWINWHVPFHIFHFSKKTLIKLLKETGFQIVSEKQKSPSLWMAQSIIARLFAKPGHTTKQLRNPLLVGFLMVIIRFLLFPLLWAGNLSGRGDCLVVVAKKV